MLPPLIHCIWLQGAQYSPFTLEELQSRYPKFKVLLWDETSIRALLQTRYEDYLVWFLSLSTLIQKCDVARAFILHAFGGVYADLDFFPHTSFAEAYSALGDDRVHLMKFCQFPWVLNNCWIACAAKSPFWLQYYIPYVKDALQSPRFVDTLFSVFTPVWGTLSATGPLAYTRLRSSGHIGSHAANAFGLHGAQAKVKTERWYNPSEVQTRMYIGVVVIGLFFFFLRSVLKG